MKRVPALFSVIVILGACGVGGWIAIRPSLALFLVPGATDIQVASQGWGAWQIRYDAPGSPTTWYTDVTNMLDAHGWSSPDRVEYGSLSRTYSHAVSLGFCELWEWAFLTFNPLRPRDAHINVRRWIAIPWWRHRSE